jgi:FxsC-like protein
MAYDFFVSYARANNDAYLKRFVEDLSVEVRVLRGLPKDANVAFFDQQDIELGEDWDGAIANALATTPVVLATSSAAYFKSDYCGRELALFERRFPAGSTEQGFPPVIKPVVWSPFKMGDVPASVGRRQFTFGDPAAIHNVSGIRSMLKQLSVHEAAYVQLVESLARQIVEAATAHPMPALIDVPRLQAVRGWFTVGAAPAPTAGAAALAPVAAAAVTPAAGATPDRVHFIYLAASPEQFGPARDAEPYLRVGGPEWKPFFPDTRPIHRFLQSIVSSDELAFTSDEVAFADLTKQIEAAWERRAIVVLVIDAWSLFWDASRAARQYAEALAELDRRNFFNCCVLVPWNEADAEVRARGARLTEALQAALPFRSRVNRNPMFFRDDLKSFDQLKAALSEMLVLLRDEIRRLAQVHMPIPDGPSKTVVSGAPR